MYTWRNKLFQLINMDVISLSINSSSEVFSLRDSLHICTQEHTVYKVYHHIIKLFIRLNKTELFILNHMPIFLRSKNQQQYKTTKLQNCITPLSIKPPVNCLFFFFFYWNISFLLWQKYKTKKKTHTKRHNNNSSSIFFCSFSI